jgi:hypothetical protein
VRSLTSRVLPVPLASGALALVVASFALVPLLRPMGWDVTVLPRVGSVTPLGAAAKRIDPNFRTAHAGGYDGQFYWAIALDPVATGSIHRDIDNPSYRYGHPLYGWLGWLFSAGQGTAAAAALLAVGLASLTAAAAAAAWLGRRRGSAGWEGLFVTANVGLVYAATHDLAEPLCAALLLGGLGAYCSGRRKSALLCFALLPLAKEPLVLVPVAVAAWELWRNRASIRTVLPLAGALLPSVCWWVYARIHLGAWFTSGGSALGAPFSGWKRALLDAGVRAYSAIPSQNQTGEETLAVLVVLLALLAVAGLFALRLRGPVELIFVALGAIVLCLAPSGTTILRDAVRNTALLVVLVPFVTASPPLLPTSWALRGAGNSTRRPPSPT